MAEYYRQRVITREPRQRAPRFSLEPLIVPAMIGGALLFYAVYKDQINGIVQKTIDLIPHIGEVIGSIDIPIYPLPPIEFPPIGGGSFNSNSNWVGRAGQTVERFGNTGPNGKGFHAEASGNPRIKFITPTEYELQGSGSDIHPRIYGAVNNYNARLELDFKFMSNSVENISLKLRSRHQMGGSCENRVGGFGAHISRSVGGFQIEKCHNEHDPKVERRLRQNISTGTYHRAAFTVQDTAQGILQKLDIDGAELIRTVYTGNYAPYRNKSMFDRHSEFWIRYNGNSGAIRFKNVRLIQLGGTSNLAYAYHNRYRLGRGIPMIEPRITVPY